MLVCAEQALEPRVSELIAFICFQVPKQHHVLNSTGAQGQSMVGATAA